MSQSRHGQSGDIRIPKNHPYRRVRHISWNDLSDSGANPKSTKDLELTAEEEEKIRALEVDEEVDESHYKDGAWEF